MNYAQRTVAKEPLPENDERCVNGSSPVTVARHLIASLDPDQHAEADQNNKRKHDEHGGIVRIGQVHALATGQMGKKRKHRTMIDEKIVILIDFSLEMSSELIGGN
ncbi:hypothetical protein [Haloterrigena salinisoli]|uniref:hypothetical protein n=1 Tax=Haloterrigena salinisoli TaxID=3132747 RepID=UPI0030D322D7